MKNRILKFGLLAFFWAAYTLPVFAQGPDDPDDGNDPQAPIDNWILLLVLAGIALGIYFIIRNQRKAIA